MTDKQNNTNNTHHRTTLRRHTTKRHTANTNKVYEIQIKHLTQKLRRNIAQIPKLDLKQEHLTINNYITCLQIPPEHRTTEHVGVIHYYLNRTNIIDKFNNDGIDPINHTQMLITTSTHAKYKHITANEMIYDYLTKADFTYVIVSGKVVLHYPTPMKATLTGYEYYTYIIDLLHNNDVSSLQALSEHYNNSNNNGDNSNVSEYYFSYSDVNVLKHIALKLHFDKQNVSDGDNVDVLRTLFEVIKLNPSDIGINSDDNVNTVIDKIKACIDDITYEQYTKYSYILNTTTKHEVTLYTFKPTKTMHEGDYFGESIHNNSKYNCKCYTSDDTQLCVISNYIYNTYLHIDKNNSMLKEINFLYDKYFFRKIVKRKFEREYFKLFTKRIYKKHQTIITEDFLLQHIYFIQDGTIELSSNKSVVETHHSIKQLTRGSSPYNNNTEIYNSFFSNIRSKPLHMLSQLTDKASKTIVVTSSNEVLGVDSMLHKINRYLYTAKVVSNYATVYALSVDDLMFILENEGNEVARDFERTAVMKGDLLKERFVNVNTSALGVVDRAIASENYYKGHKIDLINYNEVSCKHKHINKAALTKHFNTNNITDVLLHCDSNISNSNSNIHSLQYKTIESSASMVDKVNRGLSSNKCILPSISVKKTSLNKLDKYKTLSIKSFEDRIYHKVQKQHKLIQQSLISYSQKEESTTLNNNNDGSRDNSGTLTQPSEKELLNVTNAFITALPPSSEKIEIKDDIHLLSETSSHKKLNTINLHLKKPYRSPFVKCKLQKYSIFDSNNINYSLKPTEPYYHKQYRMHSSYGTKIGSGIKDLIEKDMNTFTTCNNGLSMPIRNINSSSILKLKGNSPKHTVNSTYKKHILKKINELYYI